MIAWFDNLKEENVIRIPIKNLFAGRYFIVKVLDVDSVVEYDTNVDLHYISLSGLYIPFIYKWNLNILIIIILKRQNTKLLFFLYTLNYKIFI